MEEATYRGAVYPWQCDHVGHMNIMWYVGKFDEANWNMFARLGLTPSYLRQSGRGMAGVQQNITYKRELFAGAILSKSEAGYSSCAKSPFASCMKCTMPRPVKSPRPARSRRCISTGKHTNPCRSRMRSAPSRRDIWCPSRRRRETNMPRFEPRNPDFRRIAAETLGRQQAMRTLTISEARAYALRDGGEHLIATMTGTLMAMHRREAPSASERVLSPV
jgi:hypothetical protein